MKPMLASPAVFEKLTFPKLASVKLDGVRALIRGGVVLGRSLKPIPNAHVQKLFGKTELEGFDGELIVGAPNAEGVYRRTMSGVMSRSGEPEVTFYAFDRWDLDGPFSERIRGLSHNEAVEIVPNTRIYDLKQLETLEAAALAEGYEGLMLRDEASPYKFGRATAKEGWLLKVKRHLDAEAEVIGVEERMHNRNEAKKNALGRTERSTHAAGMEPAGDLGALVCRTPEGVEFRIGTGFTPAQRIAFWRNRHRLPGMKAKYKYFPVGVKVAPRHPVFLGFRHEVDL